MRKPAPRTSRSAFRVLHSALALALMAAAATADAATYYASPTGAADATCMAEDPGTIQAAVNKAASLREHTTTLTPSGAGKTV